MIIADLYIGADNKTGVLDLERICAITDETFEGYTVIGPNTGRWHQKSEQSCIVRVFEAGPGFTNNVFSLREVLKSALEQEAIPIIWTECEISW